MSHKGISRFVLIIVILGLIIFVLIPVIGAIFSAYFYSGFSNRAQDQTSDELRQASLTGRILNITSEPATIVTIKNGVTEIRTDDKVEVMIRNSTGGILGSKNVAEQFPMLANETRQIIMENVRCHGIVEVTLEVRRIPEYRSRIMDSINLEC